MTKDKKSKKHSIKSKVAWNIAIFLTIAIIITGTVLWDYYALWAYADFSFLKADTPTPTATFSPTPTKAPTPAPTATLKPSTSISETITPIPTPSPIPHPGDRDGRFTDGEIKIKENSYQSDDLSVEITKYYENDITYYIAEVYIRNIESFYAAFADGKYGSYRARTTEMAEENNAIFAVSGDYYNAREGGLIIRNSEIYRNEKEPYREVLAIYDDGSMKGYRYKEAYRGTLAKDKSVYHTYVFGPILVSEGMYGREFSDKEMAIRHPRLGIGMIEPYHYIFLLADGRKEGYSIGMTVVEMANIFLEYGCTEAYNLDGGGTATMVFMNELVNLPQGTTKERGIGDAICFID